MAIRGVGEYQAKPDYATLHVTITTRNRSTEQVIQAHARQIAQATPILDELKKQGLEIRKSNFRLRSEQKVITINNPKGLSTQKPTGPREFIAQTNYEVVTRKIDGLSELVGRLASSEVFEMSSISYDVDDPRRALLQARKAAVTDAREQAEIYADTARIELIQVSEITDGEASRARFSDGVADLPSRRVASGEWVSVAQIVPPATLSYDATVNIVWRIGPKAEVVAK